MAKHEPVIVVAPDNAPLVSVAVPSVILPPLTAPDAVIVVAPVTAPPSTFTLPSRTTAEPDAGVRSVSYTHLTLPTIYSV